MINTLKQIIFMRTALWVNAFLYYLKRLPLAGKLVPDSVYANYSAKKRLAAGAFLVRQLVDITGKPLYLLFFVLLPAQLLSGKVPVWKGQTFSLMAHILFFLNCIIGSLGDSQIFTVTRDKITLLKYMKGDVRSYTHAALCLKYVPFFLYYLPFLILFSLLCGGTAVQGLFLWILLAAARGMGEAFQLFVFDRTGKVYYRNMACSWAIIGIGLAGAYLLPLSGISLPASFLLHPVSMVFWLACGGFSLYYIITGYKGYEQKLIHSIDINFLLTTIMKSSSASSFKEVEVREKDAELSLSVKQHTSALRGYAYFNSLFFARHRRQLLRPVYYRLIAVAAIFALSVVFLLLNRPAAVKLGQNMTSLLPSFVYIMYFLTVADKACRAMFYNCDKDMLHYSFYRRPDTILKNFRVRLMYVSLYDAVIAGALCPCAVIFRLLCGVSIFTADMLLFCLAILLLSVLFTAHHLCLYYIFQPYSESLQIKNPFFSVINIIMYALCFLCLEIKVTGSLFTLGVLGFTVIYIAAALVLVYFRSPKAFRVK